MDQMKLNAGAGKAEIHFSEDMLPTDGFCGIHDLPCVRLLVLDSTIRVAIAAIELVNVPEDAVDLSREVIAKKTGTPVENVWIHATHAITTPHAPIDPSNPPFPPDKPPKGKPEGKPDGKPDGKPQDKEPGPPPMDPDGARKRKLFMDALMQAVNEAADQAAALVPAKLGVGTGTSNVNCNRDIETPFGWWVGINPDGPSNKTMQIIRVDDCKDQPISLLISYGLKPCAIDNSQMEQNTRLISSDVPGEACRQLEQEFGGVCLFTMAAAGDQVPREQALTEYVAEDGTVKKNDLGVEKGLEMVARLGTEMAKDVRQAAEQIKCTEDAPVIARGKTSVKLEGKGRVPMKPTKEITFESNGRPVELDADIITIGDTALVAEKPEVNTVTEKQLQEGSPYAHTLLIEMVNGGMKYLPDQDSYDRVTWEALSASLMPGCAEKWVSAAADKLKEMKENG